MKPITLSSNLKQLMAKEGLTTASLARLTGIGQPVIYRMISGETDNPKIATLIPIADYFNISISQLVGDLDLQQNRLEISKVPLLSWEEAIHWQEIIPNRKNQRTVVTTDKVSDNAYALVTKDTTMQPKFPENTILIINPEVEPKNKDYVVVHLADQNEATFKQLLFDGSQKYLKPLNTDFAVTPIHNNKTCHFLGVLAEARMRF